MRKRTRAVRVGGKVIGGGAPVLVQSMMSTPSTDAEATLAQARRLVDAGCEMVRVAVPGRDALATLERLKAELPVPVVADIHFDHRLAVEALKRGADKVRINPGNIGAPARAAKVFHEANRRGAAVRIGVNAGSLDKKLLEKYGHPCAEALAESALEHITFARNEGVDDLVVSIKSSRVRETITACHMLADATDTPQHIGITEAGSAAYGSIKSAVGLGVLLLEGIGDTIRVSLTGDPVEEVRVAYDILKATGVRIVTPEIISCPTCGRMQSDMSAVAAEVERLLAKRKLPIRVAVMGCSVNGPGEAREADVGIAGGKKHGLLFRKGEVVRKVAEADMVDALMAEVDEIARSLEADRDR
jgi:(E)-4-hydroxy-3-methylbut-2-enyl-diphosphate synthase